MSITPQLDRYLSVRRSLGYDLRTEERRLRRFARFADQEGAPHIDTALFLRWDASLPAATTSTRSARLSAVRLFAQWLSSIDPAHEVPPRGLLPDRSPRPRPHIYSEGRDRIDHRSGQGAAVDLRLAWADLLDPVRAHRGHRLAHQRGACARP
jgi:hypothetical protein